MNTRKIINIILVIMLLFFCYKIGDKLYNNYVSRQLYENIKEEKESSKNVTKYLRQNNYDWITIPNTYINYPIAFDKGNDFYLTHNIKGELDNSGAIFYEETEFPYEGINTIVYGHSMNDGSMFNNLHLFKEDERVFRESNCIINTKEGERKEYKPLGVYVTNDDFFIYNLDNMSIDNAVKLIQEKSKYKIDVEYSEKSEILTLLTCEYTEKGNRLIVFYIN